MTNDINGEHLMSMTALFLARFTLPVTPANKIRPIAPVRTMREAISMIANPEDVEVDGYSLEGSAFAPNEIFDDYFQSADKIFTFPKS
jgi:hypothetical protein